MVFVFVFLGNFQNNTRRLPRTDQFTSHHCMHKRRSGPDTSTFLNMKEITHKSLVLAFEVMFMQSQSSLNKQSPGVSCWACSGCPRLSCVLVMPLATSLEIHFCVTRGASKSFSLPRLSPHPPPLPPRHYHHRLFHHLHLYHHRPSISIHRHAV